MQVCNPKKDANPMFTSVFVLRNSKYFGACCCATVYPSNFFNVAAEGKSNPYCFEEPVPESILHPKPLQQEASERRNYVKK